MRWERLEDQYYHWLEQSCRCESEEFCNCRTFNEWINDLMEDLFSESEEESCG